MNKNRKDLQAQVNDLASKGFFTAPDIGLRKEVLDRLCSDHPTWAHTIGVPPRSVTFYDKEKALALYAAERQAQPAPLTASSNLLSGLDQKQVNTVTTLITMLRNSNSGEPVSKETPTQPRRTRHETKAKRVEQIPKGFVHIESLSANPAKHCGTVPVIPVSTLRDYCTGGKVECEKYLLIGQSGQSGRGNWYINMYDMDTVRFLSTYHDRCARALAIRQGRSGGVG